MLPSLCHVKGLLPLWPRRLVGQMSTANLGCALWARNEMKSLAKGQTRRTLQEGRRGKLDKMEAGLGAAVVRWFCVRYPPRAAHPLTQAKSLGDGTAIKLGMPALNVAQ
jgi:hypothetical protein